MLAQLTRFVMLNEKYRDREVIFSIFVRVEENEAEALTYECNTHFLLFTWREL